MSHRAIREALSAALALLKATRGHIRNTDGPSWDIAMAALIVLIDQHDGRYLRPTWRRQNP